MSDGGDGRKDGARLALALACMTGQDHPARRDGQTPTGHARASLVLSIIRRWRGRQRRTDASTITEHRSSPAGGPARRAALASRRSRALGNLQRHFPARGGRRAVLLIGNREYRAPLATLQPAGART